MRNGIERTRNGVYSVAMVALASTAATLASPAAGQEIQQAGSQDALTASVSLSSDRATLTLALPDGATRTIRLEKGTLFIDGVKRADYEPGGPLDTEWRSLLRSPAVFSAEGLAEALRDWSAPAEADESAAAILEAALDSATGSTPPANIVEVADAVGEEVQMEGPNGGVSIAPGRLSFGQLGDQLERLRSSLDRLGEDASDADEELALIVHDSYGIASDRTVEGNLALLDGELDLDGTVSGDVLVLDGVLNLMPNATIEGDILQVGGEVQQHGDAHVAGELLSIVPLDPPAPAAAPDVRVRSSVPRIHVVERSRGGFFGSVYRNFERAMDGLGTTLGWFIGLGLAGLGLVYFTRPRLEAVADTARNNVARSFATGLAGEVLFFPVSLILVVAVITWLLIPFYALAVALALIGGYLAVAHAAGEILAARRFRSQLLERLRRSNSYYYVLSGLAFLLIPYALVSVLWAFGGPLSFLRGLTMFVACVVTWAAVTLGFGAVILSRGGTRTEHARGHAGYTSRVPFASEKEDVA
jgi:hypothetical protein